MANVFVFGSNSKGIHGKGAALEAIQKWGAIYGQGEGRQGNSYAIPTKFTPYTTLPIEIIGNKIQTFLKYAAETTGDTFILTPIGTGLAGYTHEQIAPLFTGYSQNVHIPEVWKEYFKIMETP